MAITINPSTGEQLREWPDHGPDEIEAILARAHETQRAWRQTAIERRAELLLELAAGLRAREQALAELMADEMGKPITQGRAEIDKCVWACEYFARNGPALLADQPSLTEARASYVSAQPLGVVLAIMPWNFPIWQVLRAAVPALLAGNTIVLKHAESTTGCAFELDRVFRDAGFAIGTFEVVVCSHEVVERLIAEPRVAAVTLTGSVRAGRAVAAAAGRALKKVVLELGGSDPYVVLADADLDLAAEICTRARLHNSGQTCIAAKRWIVVDEVADAFRERALAHLQAAVVGDPRDEVTQVGPLARVDLRDGLHDQVHRSVDAGARLLLGGRVPEGRGAFYPVTLLEGVRPGMPAADEELFGPVAVLMRAQNEDEALALANASDFGLGAAVFTRDLARGEKIAREQLAAGACFVNEQVRSDPRLPFGGIKDSGYGRELGRAGLWEFVNAKTVWVGE